MRSKRVKRIDRVSRLYRSVKKLPKYASACSQPRSSAVGETILRTFARIGRTNSVSANGRPDRSPYVSSEPDDRIAVDPIFEGGVDTDKPVVVCGAGGFIGGHLVADLLRQGSNTALRRVDSAGGKFRSSTGSSRNSGS